jgi:curli biogenesis system outer membrane secretion channel CsgG
VTNPGKVLKTVLASVGDSAATALATILIATARFDTLDIAELEAILAAPV